MRRALIDFLRSVILLAFALAMPSIAVVLAVTSDPPPQEASLSETRFRATAPHPSVATRIPLDDPASIYAPNVETAKDQDPGSTETAERAAPRRPATDPRLPLEDARRQLEQLGAEYVVLESSSDNRRGFRFYCQLPVANTPYAKSFEVYEDHPVRAMELGVQQVAQWVADQQRAEKRPR